MYFDVFSAHSKGKNYLKKISFYVITSPTALDRVNPKISKKQIHLEYVQLLQHQILQKIKSSDYKEIAIYEIVKIIQDFQYNDELSEKYKREILDQDKMYD